MEKPTLPPEEVNPNPLTPAESQFVNFFEDGDSIAEAAYKAFPLMKEPLRKAQLLLSNHDFVRTRLRVYCDQNHMSDEQLVKNLHRTMAIAEDDPKASAALLNSVKEAMKLKDLYAKTQIDPNTQAAPTLTQFQIIQQFATKARDAGLSDEDIDTLTESPIIDVKVIPKTELFE